MLSLPTLARWLPASSSHPLRSGLPPLMMLSMAGIWTAFVHLGAAKPAAQWNIADLISEGGIVAMSAIWLFLMTSGRPAGRVTSLIAFGLAGICLGFWTDLMDEFYRLPKTIVWDNWLESGLTLFGMLTFTCAMVLWRSEQRVLNERLLKRERIFRDHRSYDGITQLADAGYMATQIRLAAAQGQGPVGILMLGLRGHAARSRSHGAREANRELQAVSLLWLLNLPANSLLCRYAADRFCVLLPDCDAVQAEAVATHLRDAVTHLQHHTVAGERVELLACMAWESVAGPMVDSEAVLRRLQLRLDA